MDGWANPQTWCVALFIDNDQNRLRRAANCVRPGNAVMGMNLLRDLAREQPGQLYSTAPWAWHDGQSLASVDWLALYQHYREKIKEGV